MSVSAVSSSSSTTSTTAASTSSGIDTSDFLTLLVAQLQNQNPLDPVDTNEFMDQMLSYASYDMQTQMNDQISSLTSAINAMSLSSVIGYLGQTVEAYGDTTTLQDGKATWGYTLGAEASDVTITVKSEAGAVVWEGSGETSAGAHTFEWDGVTSDGTQLTSGQYTIEITATNASGESVYGTTSISGVVTSVDSSSGVTVFTVNGIEINLDSIFSVKA